DEAKATTRASTPSVASPSFSPIAEMPVKPMATRSWLTIIHPRRRPKRPNTGATSRSMAGAHKNLTEYASPTHDRNPIAPSVVPSSRSQYPSVFPVSRNGSPDEKPNMSITATLGWRIDAITSRLRVGFTVSVMPFLFFRRDVALARPRLESPLRHSHVDAVRFAVVFGRRVAEEILTVELVRHLGEGRAEILAEANLRVAAAGLLGDACETGVGQVFEQRRLESTGTDSGM